MIFKLLKIKWKSYLNKLNEKSNYALLQLSIYIYIQKKK